MPKTTCLVCHRSITGGSYCPPCKRLREERRQSRQPYRDDYNTPEHRAFRRAVRARAAGKCEACRLPETPEARHHVHHLVPLSKGGDNRASNGALLCTDCHKRAHGANP